jgi:diketogulonate reductase-like aldo/keto reductase
MMESLVDKGLCRSIGISNFSAHDIASFSHNWKIVPLVNQASDN